MDCNFIQIADVLVDQDSTLEEEFYQCKDLKKMKLIASKVNKEEVKSRLELEIVKKSVRSNGGGELGIAEKMILPYRDYAYLEIIKKLRIINGPGAFSELFSKIVPKIADEQIKNSAWEVMEAYAWDDNFKKFFPEGKEAWAS